MLCDSSQLWPMYFSSAVLWAGDPGFRVVMLFGLTVTIMIRAHSVGGAGYQMNWFVFWASFQ